MPVKEQLLHLRPWPRPLLHWQHVLLNASACTTVRIRYVPGDVRLGAEITQLDCYKIQINSSLSQGCFLLPLQCAS